MVEAGTEGPIEMRGQTSIGKNRNPTLKYGKGGKGVKDGRHPVSAGSVEVQENGAGKGIEGQGRVIQAPKTEKIA